MRNRRRRGSGARGDSAPVATAPRMVAAEGSTRPWRWVAGASYRRTRRTPRVTPRLLPPAPSPRRPALRPGRLPRSAALAMSQLGTLLWPRPRPAATARRALAGALAVAMPRRPGGRHPRRPGRPRRGPRPVAARRGRLAPGLPVHRGPGAAHPAAPRPPVWCSPRWVPGPAPWRPITRSTGTTSAASSTPPSLRGSRRRGVVRPRPGPGRPPRGRGLLPSGAPLLVAVLGLRHARSP